MKVAGPFKAAIKSQQRRQRTSLSLIPCLRRLCVLTISLNEKSKTGLVCKRFSSKLAFACEVGLLSAREFKSVMLTCGKLVIYKKSRNGGKDLSSAR